MSGLTQDARLEARSGGSVGFPTTTYGIYLTVWRDLRLAQVGQTTWPQSNEIETLVFSDDDGTGRPGSGSVDEHAMHNCIVQGRGGGESERQLHSGIALSRSPSSRLSVLSLCLSLHSV